LNKQNFKKESATVPMTYTSNAEGKTVNWS